MVTGVPSTFTMDCWSNPVPFTVIAVAGPPAFTAAGERDVMLGAGLSTVSVKFCAAFVPTPLEAVKVMLRMPPAFGPGVPPSTPVAALKVTPAGSVPVSLKVGVGKPVAVTVNDPEVPTVKVVLFALVIAAV